MATVEGANPYGTLAPERLEEFEAFVGVELPADFRAFLLEHNGGVPVPGEIVPPGQTVSVGTLETLYWLTPDGGPLEVMFVTEAQTWPSGVWPDELLAVGDAEGWLVCVGIAGEHLGRVILMPEPPGARPGYSVWDRAVVLADSFAAFVAALGGPQPGGVFVR